ncbi:hypothetical protein [Micromonospora saelicesensis]|uniref:Peptidase M23 n=1 Tax=Micromonospora saelicesensis TaxID=285676 RepID=A0A1C5A7S5_9ACTN|nr:hypothetical protein [Micromonospora saelicesensis]RAN94759.1 hypothetical protein GAR05_04849 [Micromonospora saelicesensis]RAO44543.1 hypothetical protein GAR06_03866 [Micromonospora saelicesensis]RAO50559.1 hypothetical protein PSN01_04497 [Micromonospora saelicesensis]RAO55114.1 hypothetical protein LUPAC06_04416 [Micromonospora saelicesensis]SCF41278.1 hypothetical protein GA0070561_6415 [Micromonospora saelicesensis]
MHPDDPSAQKLTDARPSTPSDDAASTERTIGRHRAPDPSRRALLRSTPVRVALATGVTCCLSLVAVATARGNDDTPRTVEPLAEAVADRAAIADERASRSLDRDAAPARILPTPTAKPTPTPTAVRKAPKKPVKPRRPRPVAGLDQAQMDNAKIIVDVGLEMKMPRRALVVALSTAMQESNLYNLASDVLPESAEYPNQGSGSDHDSVGLFQQRPSSGWGTVAQLMRPSYAARAFYTALNEIPGWQDMSVTAAAQAVQISAYPDAYAQHEDRATTVAAALTA